jgi:hypothetical protein
LRPARFSHPDEVRGLPLNRLKENQNGGEFIFTAIVKWVLKQIRGSHASDELGCALRDHKPPQPLLGH